MASSEPATYFAPPERASAAELQSAARAVERWPIVREVLDAMPGPAVILNLQRQIIAANRRFLKTLEVERVEDVLGLRPGEALHCRQVPAAPAGCGTGRACQYCDFVQTLLNALERQDLVTGECRVLTAGGEAIDLELAVTTHPVDDATVLFVGMRDLGAEKRREVLERTFFHDVLNTAGGIQGLLTLMTMDHDTPIDDASIQRLLKLTAILIDEIRSQQQLLAAESNQLTAKPKEFELDELLRGMVEVYEKQPLGHHKQIALRAATGATMHTDPTLLSRVIGNLIKNALEATGPGGRIAVTARLAGGDAAVIAVHNDATLDEGTRAQLFQRSFSTKGPGRGVGLYSVQLFTERFLGGKVGYTSSDEDGTRFEVRVPLVLPV